MRNLRGTYVHRGDIARRRRVIRHAVLLTGCVITGGLVAWESPAAANAEPAAGDDIGFFAVQEDVRRLRDELVTARGELDFVRAQYNRASQVMEYSSRYGIGAGLAGKIYDAAAVEKLDPDLAFRLIRLESEFNSRAVSHSGAIGLTQLMPSTAIQYEKDVTRDALFDRDINLRIGFRYLRKLVDMFKGDVRLALLAYNRGEENVFRDLRAGKDPGNGYDRWVARGYKGKGTVD